MHYVIRPMRLGDVPQATQIDRECFPTQWPPPPYRSDLLFNRPARYLVAYERENRATAAEETERSPREHFLQWMRSFICTAEPPPTGQRIVGLIGFWRMAGEVHITTIGIRQAYRRQGIGELLLISTIDLALVQHAEAMTLEVRLSNSAAKALYEKYGFFKNGVRKGYYTNDREDAVIMTTDKLTSASFQSQFQQLKRAHAERWGLAMRHIDQTLG